MIWIGTSGYNYPEWRGTFYPEKLAAAKMLPYYAERFSTVEINYTFYRTPNEKILEGWNAATPDRFKLTLKAPRRITHEARLRDCADRVRQFLETAAVLGPKLGALLFQLPPNLKKDVALLCDLVREHKLPHECVPTEMKQHAEVWEALLPEMGLTATLRNLEVIEVDTEDNVLIVKGAVPGPTGGYVLVRRSKR